MMATVQHVTFGLGLRKFQADGFLLTRVYQMHTVCVSGFSTILPPPPPLRNIFRFDKYLESYVPRFGQERMWVFV